jgi:hypothetical protein
VRTRTAFRSFGFRSAASLLCVAWLAIACRTRTPAASAPPAPPGVWTYEVRAAPSLDVLDVEASFPPGTDVAFGVARSGGRFVEDVAVWDGGAWSPVAAQRDAWRIPACARGCRIRYRYALRRAARAIDTASSASTIAAEGKHDAPILEGPPTAWLLRPERAPRDARLRLHVVPARGDTFVTGIFPSASLTDTYEADASPNLDDFFLPHAALGKLRVVARHDGRVVVAFPPRAFRHEDDVLAWVDTAAATVHAYYGRFPVPRLLVLLHPRAGQRVGSGVTMGDSGASMRLAVGEDATRASLSDDWTLVHEMIHTALPQLERDHHWLEEGIATYVEPLARARMGTIAADEVWAPWVRDMPKGEPEPGDEGLDRTATWGRTYWGGALFCLAVDVEIRRRTGGARSLDDALRAIGAEGTIADNWPIERLIAVGDRATGVPVLAETYARMATHPERVDLAAIWRDLGVVPRGSGVKYDDAAPLAAIRKAMTRSN